MDSPKITSVEFEEVEQAFRLPGVPPPMAVKATWDDGTENVLFSFYSDEIQFSRDEFVGLTSPEVSQLLHRRHTEYLQS